MRIKSLCTLLILCVLLPGLVLSLSGCSGDSSQSSSVQDPVAADSSDPVVDEPDVAEESVTTVSVPPVSEENAPVVEPVIEDPVEQAILTWARNAGGLNHCDQLSIYGDGRVEAIVCRGASSEPMILGSLSDEQLALVMSWSTDYATFSRRTAAMSSAVISTVVHGIGDTQPEPAIKVEAAAFAAELFFTLTGTE